MRELNYEFDLEAEMISARDGVILAGRLQYTTDEKNGAIHLCDLRVYDKALVPMGRLRRSVLRLVSLPTQTRNYRRHGIGQQLLSRLIQHARTSGLVEIWGEITHDDYKGSPFLLEWYKRNGFTVGRPDERCLSNSAHKIMMSLIHHPKSNDRARTF